MYAMTNSSPEIKYKRKANKKHVAHFGLWSRQDCQKRVSDVRGQTSEDMAEQFKLHEFTYEGGCSISVGSSGIPCGSLMSALDFAPRPTPEFTGTKNVKLSCHCYTRKDLSDMDTDPPEGQKI